MVRKPVYRSEIKMRLVGVLLILFGSFGLSGCDRVSSRLHSMKDHWSALLGGIFPALAPKPGATPKPGVTSTDTEFNSEKAKQAKANADLLKEMITVVLMQEPKDSSFFANYADSINQGASLEGVYNGFAHSSYYRQLETQVKGAAPQALDFFASEMVLMLTEEKTPSTFDSGAALPLPTPISPAEMVGEIPDVVRFGGGKPTLAPTPEPKPKTASGDELKTVFKNASVFTLKRVLADEALKVIAEKKADSGQFAAWYAKQVTRWCDLQVDFGLALRNDKNEKFHQDWAASSGVDRVTWEILNRLHRILNAKNQNKA